MRNLKLHIAALILLLIIGFAPDAEGQWVQTNGLYGGYIQALIVSDSNLFVGTEKDGILRSSDNGVSWNSASTGLPATAVVDAFAVSGTNIYAGTLGDGVFLSTDNGMNWTTLGFTEVSSLAVSGMNLIIGTNSGVAVLTDNGNKWVSDGLKNKSINTLAVIGSIFFAGTTTGVFLSTDSGKTWTTADSGLVQHGDTLYVNTLTASGTDLFAAAGGGVFRSTDVGKSWFAVDTGLPSFIGITSFALSGANLFVGSEEGWVFRSTDKGTSWSVADTGLPTYTNKTSLAVSGAILFAGTQSNGLFVSTDNGSSWSITSIGLFNTSDVPALAVMGSDLFAGSNAGVFLSKDTGTNWQWTDGGLNSSVTALRVNGTNLFAGTYNDSVYLSTDSGKSWIAKSSCITSYGNTEYIADFVVSGSNIYARTASLDFAYDGNVYCSTDSATSWISIDTSQLPITSFAAFGTKLFAGTINNGIYQSTNNGATWNSAGQGLPDSLDVTALLASGTKLYAGSDKVYLSSDSGTSWVNISGGFTTYATLNSFLLVGENLFASANPGSYSVGVSLTTDNGISWKDMGLGQGEYICVRSLAAIGEYVFAGTWSEQEGGQGILRRPLSQMIAPSAVDSRPVEIQSITTYPNPFSQSTTISFTSSESGVAEVSVVNILGTEVGRIFSGELQSGEHSFSWDASGMQPGMYECVVRMNRNAQRVSLAVVR